MESNLDYLGRICYVGDFLWSITDIRGLLKKKSFLLL